MDIKEEIDTNTITVRDFNTSLTSMDRYSRQEIIQEMAALNDTLDQMNLIDIFRAFFSYAAEHTFLSSAHGSLSSIDHVFGHKINPDKFNKIEIISSIFSDHDKKLQINHK